MKSLSVMMKMQCPASGVMPIQRLWALLEKSGEMSLAGRSVSI